MADPGAGRATGTTGAAGRDGARRFAPGDLVRTRTVDPAHHTRLPRYARGQVGTVVDVQGAWPLADDRARVRSQPSVEAVYTVRFAARDLWGEGSHWVHLELWQSYLEPVRQESTR